MNAAISVSYCGDHKKGSDGAEPMPGHLHTRMLARTVAYLSQEGLHGYLKQQSGNRTWPVIVCATSFPGIVMAETSAACPEREYLWEVFRAARLVTMSANPGHQQGAQWAIRMGIEAASKLGYDYLIHTAEDIVPHPGALFRMVDQMHREGADYIGERWAEELGKTELNAQFFGCRVSWFATHFDGGSSLDGTCTERYMADLVYGHGRKCSFVERLYWHTHDPEEHGRFIESARTGKEV